MNMPKEDEVVLSTATVEDKVLRKFIYDWDYEINPHRAYTDAENKLNRLTRLEFLQVISTAIEERIKDEPERTSKVT
jgi:hypothetical protein